MCKAKYAGILFENGRKTPSVGIFMLNISYNSLDRDARHRQADGIIQFTLMDEHDETLTKRRALEGSGTFNPRAGEVRHRLFAESGFFDPHDMVQLKYEALRALEKDDYSVAKAAREFGLSRPSVYQAQSDFRQRGMEGLLPRKRGPKAAHKLTAEVWRTLEDLRIKQPWLKAEELARRLGKRHKIGVHPRTIEKALQAERAKRGRRSQGRER